LVVVEFYFLHIVCCLPTSPLTKTRRAHANTSRRQRRYVSDAIGNHWDISPNIFGGLLFLGDRNRNEEKHDYTWLGWSCLTKKLQAPWQKGVCFNSVDVWPSFPLSSSLSVARSGLPSPVPPHCIRGPRWSSVATCMYYVFCLPVPYV
jgi:hypothetical protein